MASWQKKNEYDIEKICRVCLQTKTGMRPLFENLLPAMVTELSGIQVSPDDGLPNQLCIQCVHSVSRANAVREMIIKSTQTLCEYIEIKKNEPKSDEFNNGNPYNFVELPTGKNGNGGEQQQFTTSSQILQDFYEDQGQALSEQVLEEQQQTAAEVKTPNDEPEDDVYMQAVALQAATSILTPGRHMCNLCHKEFKHGRWLKAHMRAHTNWIRANYKRPPSCSICQKSFKGPGMLRMHMKSHEVKQPKPPTCTVCRETFETKASLYKHRQTHFEQKIHQCHVCSKVFYGAYALRSHMARHRGEKPHTCPTCSKRFYNSTDLKVHIRLHTGEKPLSCSVCSKHFRRHSTLCQHMKKHNGVKNHVCSMCGKAFFDVSKLKAHLRVHTGEKPYKCNSCPRSFSQQSALAYHTWTHGSERPSKVRRGVKSMKGKGLPWHSCSTCSRSFGSRVEMRSHACRPIAANAAFTCVACGLSFSSQYQYYSHRKQHRLQDQQTNFTCSLCQNVITGYVPLLKHMAAHNNAKTVVEEDGSEEGEENEEDDTLEIDNKMTNETMKVATVDESEHLDELNQNKESNNKKYRCGHCPKAYSQLQPLKKHIVTHTHQQETQMQPVSVANLQLQLPTVQAPQGILQLHPTQTHVQIQGQQAYPVISSVQSLQLQQQQHQVQVTTQQPQLVQTIQLHPHSQPIQLHAVGVHQVQAQQQLHVASSTCQSLIPNLVQIQPTAVAVSGLPGQQDMSGGNVAHRIILQQQNGHPTTLYLHH